METDYYIRLAIEHVVNDTPCIENPEKYFLFNKIGEGFECVLKNLDDNNWSWRPRAPNGIANAPDPTWNRAEAFVRNDVW